MLSTNPFAVAGASLPGSFLQWFLVLMILLVLAGTLFDVIHKGSARYFFANLRKSKQTGREVGGGQMVSVAVQTAVVDVLASGEFCNTKRRVAHLLAQASATQGVPAGYCSGAESTGAGSPAASGSGLSTRTLRS